MKRILYSMLFVIFLCLPSSITFAAESEKSDLSSNQADGWKQAYIDYIKAHKGTGEGNETYALVDINNDNIPELYINTGVVSGGDILCTYYNGAVIDQWMWAYGFSYLEGMNLFRDFGGQSGAYYDKIYCIKDGQFILLASGENYVQYDITDFAGNSIENFYWNGVKLASQAEYMNMLNGIYNTQQEICPMKDAYYDKEKGRYLKNGLCSRWEIIELIKNCNGDSWKKDLGITMKTEDIDIDYLTKYYWYYDCGDYSKHQFNKDGTYITYDANGNKYERMGRYSLENNVLIFHYDWGDTYWYYVDKSAISEKLPFLSDGEKVFYLPDIKIEYIGNTYEEVLQY